MSNKVLEEMTQEQLEWVAHNIVLAMRMGASEQKAKKGLREQTESLERNMLIPIGKEIKRRKSNG
jgi:hypothetical protein